MKYFFLASVLLLLSCKKLGDGKQPATEIILDKTPVVLEEAPMLPEGAIRADFIGNNDTIYAFVKETDPSGETTLIGFENELLPEITIPNSIGAQLQILKLKNFQNDVLLVNAKLKDTNFNEYYVFVWKDSLWKQPVNRFDIHKSNMSDTMIPIQNDPLDSTLILRYYSVFDLDKTNGKKYTWRLMQESIPIED